jgi:hypothetical protein
MFLITKVALVTCLLYLGISLVIEALLFLLALWKGGILYKLDARMWAGVFGVVWLISFLAAWRIIMGAFMANFPRLPIA